MLSASLRVAFLFLLFVPSTFAQNVPAPKDVLGFTPGDDRKLASWSQIVAYFQKLDAASDRVQFEEIGRTTMGRPFVYAAISSPENLKNLEKYKQINAKLADPRTFKSNDKAAQALISQGKTIVLITCGIHSTEVGSTLSSLLIAHRLASSTDAETQNILNNTIILLVPSLNPDGVDIVKNWYDKTLGTPFEGTDPPELYHKYTGHDNNRDWYAFTQVETQLTVDKIHNVWHPQIVHDIHQQGEYGSRIFLPPYMQPVEPNVPKEIVEGYTELGNFIAGDMRAKGFQGITTNSTYDAWTPARAYSHYHGGVRILSETASCKLATPTAVKYEQLRNGLGYDVRKETANFGPVWLGGEWHLRNITDYMTTAAFSLMKHAGNNRVKWLSRFYAIGKEAVRPRKSGELFAIVLPFPKNDKDGQLSDEHFRRQELLEILERGGVKIKIANAFQAGGNGYPKESAVIPLAQPYGMFAKALLEKQAYPHLLDEKGNPVPPYDVTAHTLSLLMDVKSEFIYKPFIFKSIIGSGFGRGCSSAGGMSGPPSSKSLPAYVIYRSQIPVMDEGWTRWVAENEKRFLNRCLGPFENVTDKEIRSGEFAQNAVVFPDQSPNQILNGYPKNTMPAEYTGGIGKEGVKKLRKFVEDGGTLVFLNRASRFAIEQFGLPVRDVTEGSLRKDFYIPGSILRTEINTNSRIAQGMPKESIAWFEDSPAFEVLGPGFSRPASTTTPSAEAVATPPRQGGEFESGTLNVEIIASYPKDPAKVLLSGWALGAEKIAGKAALVSINIGKGKVVLFGFRPQYRGQSLATFPLFFNAITN
jgi:murein tripeptide amidase MpaA